MIDELVYTNDTLRTALLGAKRIAAVGVSSNPIRPSHYVARYLSARGYDLIPVNPTIEGETLFGRVVRARIADIPEADGPVDMVDVFRRSEEAGRVVDEALDALLHRGLRLVWMQIGVVDRDAAARAEAKGVQVIMNRCPKIEHQRLFGELRIGGFATGVISSKLPSA